jgi:hypothetical protein
MPVMPKVKLQVSERVVQGLRRQEQQAVKPRQGGAAAVKHFTAFPTFAARLESVLDTAADSVSFIHSQVLHKSSLYCL